MEERRDAKLKRVNNGGEKIAQEVGKRLGFIWGRDRLNRGPKKSCWEKRKKANSTAGPAWEPAWAGEEAGWETWQRSSGGAGLLPGLGRPGNRRST